ncbi:MAG: NAD(P)/FAD-dependent oxidoreductase [Vicinamibacterales bacterium]
MRDVAVVGGGPAGLLAGTLLARQGHDVALFEEHESFGAPVHCAGVLSADTFEEFGIGREPVLNGLAGARFHSPSGAVVSFRSDTVEAVAVDRRQFDHHLELQARAAGVSMLTGVRVQRIETRRSSVVLHLAGCPPVRSRAVVLACGAHYGLQRALGLGLPPRFLQSALAEFPAHEDDEVEVHFGSGIAPGGFGWVIPVRRPEGPRARVGLMCKGEATTCFGALLRNVCARWGIDVAEASDARPRVRMLPLAPIARTFSDRLVAVGDAAGLVKATTGGGVYYSLVSATIAATVLDEALRRDRLDAIALGRYERMWRQRLGPELDAQLALRRLADDFTDARIESLFELARTDGIIPLMRRTARFNEHRHFILALLRHPPARRVVFNRLVGGEERPGR